MHCDVFVWISLLFILMYWIFLWKHEYVLAFYTNQRWDDAHVDDSLRPSDAYMCIIITSDNGLSPGRRQAIIWTNAGLLLIWTSATNFSEILSKIHILSFKKMHFKMSSAKWRPFCLVLNVLTIIPHGWWGLWCPGDTRSQGINSHDLRNRSLVGNHFWSKHIHRSLDKESDEIHMLTHFQPTGIHLLLVIRNQNRLAF